jgi:hypothetical protein
LAEEVNVTDVLISTSSVVCVAVEARESTKLSEDVLDAFDEKDHVRKECEQTT